ncbi:MAG: nucleotide sugar dehydrogenase [Chlamydiales bacterium]|nr:UDP-glucose/GDP-mannose dehydrogenase family protein [Chlamydiales bacterium]NCF70348.1 nucleotide sugar dehydrogenase [Chlamydiales bacterium]
MDILVVGTGYVGLVTGTCFAEMGHNVTCLDINEDKIEKLKKGIIPIFEPGLEEIIKRNVKANRLSFTTSYEESVNKNSVVFFAVHTPPQEDGSSDLSHLLSAAERVASHLDSYTVLVNKSTVPCGSAEKLRFAVQQVLDKRRVDFDFSVVSNPEFLKEGDAVNDFMKPDRIVIGVDSKQSEQVMREIYAPFSFNHEKMVIMDIPSAEMTKYAANAMLATRISFMNELSHICEELGADIGQVRAGIGSDNRIGYSFLYAGTGYGGSCFPKDIKALSSTAKSLNLPCDIVNAIERVNERQKHTLINKLENYFADKGSLKGKVIAIWGLAFKPNTDDIREAPSLTIIDHLQKAGAEIRLYDPIAMDNVKAQLDNHNQLTFCESGLETSTGADATLLVTEWKQFRSIKMTELKKVMKGHAFFDGRNQYDPQKMQEAGFDYFSIGRKALFASKSNEAALV